MLWDAGNGGFSGESSVEEESVEGFERLAEQLERLVEEWEEQWKQPAVDKISVKLDKPFYYEDEWINVKIKNISNETLFWWAGPPASNLMIYKWCFLINKWFPYTIAGPAQTLAQCRLGPNETDEIEFSLEPGKYHIGDPRYGGFVEFTVLPRTSEPYFSLSPILNWVTIRAKNLSGSIYTEVEASNGLIGWLINKISMPDLIYFEVVAWNGFNSSINFSVECLRLNFSSKTFYVVDLSKWFTITVNPPTVVPQPSEWAPAALTININEPSSLEDYFIIRVTATSETNTDMVRVETKYYPPANKKPSNITQ